VNSQPDLLFVPEFVVTADALYEHLLSQIVWDERMHSRKTASFGAPYNYSQISYPYAPFPARLGKMLQVLEMELGFAPNNCLVNYYPDGEASMGFHFDALEPLEEGTGVAIVSLGDERHLTFRHREDKKLETTILLSNGSLLYMPPQVQNEWLHGVLKQENAKGRLSLTFRQLK
jgi:alkylated DNA repair dioxygenase AlkB